MVFEIEEALDTLSLPLGAKGRVTILIEWIKEIKEIDCPLIGHLILWLKYGVKAVSLWWTNAQVYTYMLNWQWISGR